MLLEGDLGSIYRVVAVALVVLFGPVGWLVVRRKWRHTVTRKEEIRRLLALASNEAVRAEFEAAALYSYAHGYGSPISDPEEEASVSVSGSLLVRQSQYQCEVCLSPTTTRCKQCKAVHYCSGKCQIIHWRQGHKDDCRPCNITHQNIDLGVHSGLKEFKLDEVGSSGNVIQSRGKRFAKQVDSPSGEYPFIEPNPRDVRKGKDSTEVENVVNEKEADVNLMSSIHTLPDECSPPIVLGKLSVASHGNSNDSFRCNMKTSSANLGGRNNISLEQPIVSDLTNDIAIRKPNQLKSGCIDLDNHSGSSTSSGWTVSGSEEHSLSEPSTPSSGFWEGTFDTIVSKIDELDEYGGVNIKFHPSGCCTRSNVHNVEGLRSDANRFMAGDPHPASSVPKRSTDKAPISKEANLKAIRPPLLSSTKLISKDIHNVPTECSLKLREAKYSSSRSSSYCGESGSENNVTTGEVTRDGDLQSLTPDMLNNRTDAPTSNSQAVKLNEVDSLTSKVAGIQSSSTRKLAVASVQAIKNDSTHGFDGSSEHGYQLRDAGIEANKSARTLNPPRDSKLIQHSLIGTQSGVMGRSKGLFPYDLFVKLYNWNEVELRPCGLINCGNSCYANAVLQCLAFTPPLTAYFLQGLHSKACEKKKWCFTCEFETLVLKAGEGHSPLSPVRIVSRLQHIGSHLINGREEDAHEFLRYAIESMQFICLKGSDKEPSALDEETTLLGLTFGGYLRSKIECMRCGGKSERHERMMDLTVEIVGDISTLEEAIHQFTRTEILDGENKYQCSRCMSYEKAKKKLRVLEAPNVLTIGLKRFQAEKFGKLNKRIKYPEILNMAPYMSGTSDKSPIYQLYGVVVHLDVMNATFSGHYVCYIKNNQGTWFKADDSSVQEVKLDKVLMNDAYMLLYARCSPRAPRIIRSSIVVRDTRKVKSTTCKARAHSATQWDIPMSKVNASSTCNSCTSFRPIVEEDGGSEKSSFFSEVGSYSTDSTNMESTCTDDNFDLIFGDTGICTNNNRSWRSFTDSDTASSSSSPSPLHSRHDFDGYPPQSCGCGVVDSRAFWASKGKSYLLYRKECRNLVDSNCSCSSKLERIYDNTKCTSSRRSRAN